MKLNNTWNLNTYMEITMHLTHVVNGDRLIETLDQLAL